MAREGLLDRPRVRTIQLLSLHGWGRVRQGISGHGGVRGDEAGAGNAATLTLVQRRLGTRPGLATRTRAGNAETGVGRELCLSLVSGVRVSEPRTRL